MKSEMGRLQLVWYSLTGSWPVLTHIIFLGIYLSCKDPLSVLEIVLCLSTTLVWYSYEVIQFTGKKSWTNPLGSDKKHKPGRTFEVGQREYYVLTEGAEGYNALATGQTTSCTVFYGVEKNSQTLFLLHVDFPCFVEFAMEELVNDLKKKTKGKDTKFELFVFGGRWMYWTSKSTRKKLLAEIDAHTSLFGKEPRVNIAPYTPILRVKTLWFNTESAKKPKKYKKCVRPTEYGSSLPFKKATSHPREDKRCCKRICRCGMRFIKWSKDLITGDNSN